MEQYFTNFVSNHLVTKLARKDLALNDKISALGESHSILSKDIFRVGFTRSTIQLVDSVVSSMLDTVERIPKVNVLFTNILNSKTGFSYQHAQMCCAVSCACVKQTPLKKDDEVFSKLAFASFFQNVSLISHEKLALLHSQSGLDEAGLEEELREKVLRHPLESGDIVKQYKDIPFGTEFLIRHHHGRFEGVGFSSDMKGLPELSRIFAVSTHLAHLLVDSKEGASQERGSLVADMRKHYSNEAAQPSMRLLEKTLSKETSSL